MRLLIALVFLMSISICQYSSASPLNLELSTEFAYEDKDNTQAIVEVGLSYALSKEVKVVVGAKHLSNVEVADNDFGFNGIFIKLAVSIGL